MSNKTKKILAAIFLGSRSTDVLLPLSALATGMSGIYGEVVVKSLFWGATVPKGNFQPPDFVDAIAS